MTYTTLLLMSFSFEIIYGPKSYFKSSYFKIYNFLICANELG